MTKKTVSVRMMEPIGTTRIRTIDAKFYVLRRTTLGGSSP